MKAIKNFFTNMSRDLRPGRVVAMFALGAGMFPCIATASPETVRDYIAVDAALADVRDIISVGSFGDSLQKIPATPELVAIATKEKNASFVSIEDPARYADKDYVLVNVVPFATQQQLGMDVQKGCSYRVFYGDASDISDGAFYAVELCATAQELVEAGVLTVDEKGSF